MNKLNSQIFLFLNELNANNNRDWFNKNKQVFQAHQNDIKEFSYQVQEHLNKEDDIDKIKVFRIYRDVRFSLDKTPYKTHFGISFHRKKPYLRGGYYIHIQPEKTFIATGFWNPNKEDLLRIRKEIEADGEELKTIINVKSIKSLWGSIQGDEVKTSPKGFSKDHSHIDLIKKKQYMFIKNFDDKEVLNKDFQKKVIEHFKTIRPFLNYMSSVLTTNIDGEAII